METTWNFIVINYLSLHLVSVTSVVACVLTSPSDQLNWQACESDFVFLEEKERAKKSNNRVWEEYLAIKMIPRGTCRNG